MQGERTGVSKCFPNESAGQERATFDVLAHEWIVTCRQLPRGAGPRPDPRSAAMPAPSALIFSTDPLAAALLGAVIELAGARPVFGAPGERARDALLRVRPVLALVDCDDEDTCTEGFLGPALMTGASVVVFSSQRSERDMTSLIMRLGVRSLRLPEDTDELGTLVRELCAPAGG